jgi:hypothetical protein
MRHQGSTIIAMRGKIGTLAAFTDDAPTPEGPSPHVTGSQGGDLDAEGAPYMKPTKAVPEPLARHAEAFCFTARATEGMRGTGNHKGYGGAGRGRPA